MGSVKSGARRYLVLAATPKPSTQPCLSLRGGRQADAAISNRPADRRRWASPPCRVPRHSLRSFLAMTDKHSTTLLLVIPDLIGEPETMHARWVPACAGMTLRVRLASPRKSQ